MTSEIDIYRTASVLIREHGEDADLEGRDLGLVSRHYWRHPGESNP